MCIRDSFITVADCKAGYWQIPMLEEDKWLTAFKGKKVKVKVGFFYSATYTGNAATSRAVQP